MNRSKNVLVLPFALLLVLFVIMDQMFFSFGSLTPSVKIPSTGTIQESVVVRYVTGRYDVLGGHDSASWAASALDMSQSWMDAGNLVQQIHVIRPDYKALLYRNVAVIYQPVGEWDDITDEWTVAHNNGWLLKDAHGNYVTGNGDPNNPRPTTDFLVDMGNPDYQQWVAGRCKTYVDKYGFDGVMADNGLGVTVHGWLWSVTSTPINPRTGNPWTDQEIRDAWVGVHVAIKNAIGSKLLVCNGFDNFDTFYANYNACIYMLTRSPMDGFGFEDGLDIPHRSWTNIFNGLDFLQKNYSNRIIGLVNSIDSTLATATIKLVQRTDQIYVMGLDQNVLNQFNNLGSPLADYTQSGGIYSRQFEKGTVYVNPSSQTAWIG